MSQQEIAGFGTFSRRPLSPVLVYEMARKNCAVYGILQHCTGLYSRRVVRMPRRPYEGADDECVNIVNMSPVARLPPLPR